ncbi:DUF885 domain-containing protein [Kribbella yunnanensis]|uniref:DUF885 domain-containing protein n=1 Tax=Kribbella yunnanensis TaxID=190194 RepID=A0ABN2IWC7_9ACTN
MTASQVVSDVADEFWRCQSRWQPNLHAQAGLPVEHLPKGSHEEASSRASQARGLVGRLDALESGELGGDDEDTVRFLRHFAEVYAGEADHFWLTPAGTPYQNLVQLLVYADSVFAPHQFGAMSDLDNYLGLAADFGGRVEGLGELLQGQQERGIFIPRPALSGAIASISGLKTSAATSLAVDDVRLAELGPKVKGLLAQRIEAVVDHQIAPAIDKILGLLDSPAYAEAAPDGVGLSRQPGGEEAYRFLVRRETSMDTTPEDLHRLGVEQCRELSERMHEVRSALGYHGSEAEFRDVLRGRRALFAQSVQEVEKRYLGYLSRIEPLIGDYFSVLPKAPYGVARLSEDVEAGVTFGYYEAPTRIEPMGRYRYNGSNLSERSLLTAGPLIYHELIPGHHFHLARQFESVELPDFRRYAAELCGAFAEGWAEYASGLGWEMGLYDDPWDAYGRLAHERFTAARLVIDTALNCGWWTYDEALSFMRANTTESETQLKSELLRYATDLPGQALGYRAGFLGISRLRADAERRCRTQFDIREFHEAVLGGGAMPFTVLEPRVSRRLPGRPS